MIAEAEAYFPRARHGIEILKVLRTMTTKTRNIANRTIEFIIETDKAAISGCWNANVVKTKYVVGIVIAECK